MSAMEITVEPLLEKIRAYDQRSDLNEVRKAFDFACSAHAGQVRASGLPYIVHPLRAAEILAEMKVPLPIIIAGLLHDVPEDTTVSTADIKKAFGPDVASMVAGITKLGKLKYRGIERYVENLRKMFVAMASDVRVIIIKFADRIHNLETLDALPPEKRLRVALESLEIYAPIANRLGLHELRTRLEDLSFRHVMPQEYEWTKALAEKAIASRSHYIERVQRIVEQDLKASNIAFLNISGRVKHLYSLYRKLLKHERDIVQIHDLMALRLLVPEVGDCYAALGIIHHRWKPLKGRIKDYIALPKPNGYRSLHTTVFCEDGEIVEFQIRTPEMHDEAERGIAAHWFYDAAGKRSVPARQGPEMAWMRDLADLDEPSGSEFLDHLEAMKVDVFQDRIFVFTPHGDVIDLPEGATPVAFAYAIHSNIGDQMAGARVNDEIVSLDNKLSSGDCCEIITDKNRHGPNPDWLEFVKTGHARSHIKAVAKSRLARWVGDEAKGTRPTQEKSAPVKEQTKPKRRTINTKRKGA
jgi:GTP diphosphokinase / guanosine-3',5'-bis(diphosphate) 3'-diphosphatase